MTAGTESPAGAGLAPSPWPASTPPPPPHPPSKGSHHRTGLSGVPAGTATGASPRLTVPSTNTGIILQAPTRAGPQEPRDPQRAQLQRGCCGPTHRASVMGAGTRPSLGPMVSHFLQRFLTCSLRALGLCSVHGPILHAGGQMGRAWGLRPGPPPTQLGAMRTAESRALQASPRSRPVHSTAGRTTGPRAEDG